MSLGGSRQATHTLTSFIIQSVIDAFGEKGDGKEPSQEGGWESGGKWMAKCLAQKPKTLSHAVYICT